MQKTCEELESLDANDQDISTSAKLRGLLLEAERSLAFFDGLVQQIMPGTQGTGAEAPRVPWRLWTRGRNEVHAHLIALRNTNRNILETLAILQA